jgi:hypothetical protein
LVKKMTRMPEPLPDAGEIGKLALRLLERDPRLRPPTALHVSAEIVRLIDDDPKTVLAPSPWVVGPVPMFNDSSILETDVAMRPIRPDAFDSHITSTDMQAIDPAVLFAQAALQQPAAVPEPSIPPASAEPTMLAESRTAVAEVVARVSMGTLTATAPVSLRPQSVWTPSRLTYLIVAASGVAIGLLAVLYVLSR